MTGDGARIADALARLEARLDPSHPERAGVRVLAYGEISAALIVTDEPALAGTVVKRMSGFRDASAAREYVALLTEYLTRLTDLGVETISTRAVVVPRDGRGPTVFLVQPQVSADSLGDRLLHSATDSELAEALTAVLGRVEVVLRSNLASPDDEISVDAQMSNWVFGSDRPVLLDVGTPFVRRGGHQFDQEILLSAVPPGIRAYYRRKGTASEYMDDYFDARLIAVDILGNFFKEGAADRLGVGIDVVDAWLTGPAVDLPQDPSRTGPVTVAEVAEYYEADAATLELFLRVRRLDRGIRRLVRRPYDFILPGPVNR
ncbi:MAG: DUF6206 family protein [Candidatus Nanopelagicales bacterium]